MFPVTAKRIAARVRQLAVRRVRLEERGDDRARREEPAHALDAQILTISLQEGTRDQKTHFVTGGRSRFRILATRLPPKQICDTADRRIL